MLLDRDLVALAVKERPNLKLTLLLFYVTLFLFCVWPGIKNSGLNAGLRCLHLLIERLVNLLVDD